MIYSDKYSKIIIDLIESGKINFVVNTPTKGKQSNRDGFKIRRMAVECKIPCFTSLDTVNALYKAIEKGTEEKVKYKKDNSAKQLSKQKEKIEKEIEKLMLELEDLNEKLSDENLTADWMAYRTLAHDSKVVEEKIEELMLKLESFDS